MKQILLTTTLILLTQTATATPFHPYADITLKTHWDDIHQAVAPDELNAISQQSGVKHFNLAFITDSGNCNPAWASQPTYSVKDDWAVPLTDQLRAAKINYSISFGGAVNPDLSMQCSEPQLLAAYETVLKKYQPQELDFDIENGTADVTKVMHALHQLRKNHAKLPISFTIPVMPEGLTVQGEKIIKAAQKEKLNFVVNIMAMDYGSSYLGNMGQYAIQAASNVHEFLQTLYPKKSSNEIWKMIAVTPMIGVNDIEGEEFTLQDASTLNEFAKQKKLAWLSMWSIARDVPCADVEASPLCSGKGLQKKNYEYSARFIA